MTKGDDNMKIGYIRVSTAEQHTDRQDLLLKESGAEKIFTEKISGKDANRPQLQSMLAFARAGDIIYVESISRLGRSLHDLLNIMDILRQKDVGFVSLKESVIDTTTAEGAFVLHIFAALSEYERKLIKSRQHQGIEIAKQKGVYKGRQRLQTPDNFPQVYQDWVTGKITAVQAMMKLKMTKSTYYRRVREYKKGLSK